jgi:hypothetical protein
MAARVVTFLLALSLLLAAGLKSTHSAFSGTAASSGNVFQAVADFSAGSLQMATGSYVGDGVDDRSIATGFQPDIVIIKSTTTEAAVIRTSTMAGDATWGPGGIAANRIQGLDATGFRVGTDAAVNGTGWGTVYHWVALKAGSPNVSVGTYTGNGAARTVTGLGYAPEWVGVLGAGTQTPMQRYAGMAQAFDLDQGAGSATAVTAFGADGFSLGTSADVATNGTTFHWIAINDVAGAIDVSSFTGNAVNDRQITGIGFQPGYVMLRAEAGSLGAARARPGSLTGTDSLAFGPSAVGTTGIRALLADGFGVGTDGGVNGLSTTYHYTALRNTKTGCSAPGTQTTTPSQAAYVDESQPTSNFSAQHLRVRSGNRTRALVRFSPPAIPTGCTVTAASLRFYAETKQGTRNLEAVRVNANWAEGSVTWANQPATTGTAVTVPNGTGSGFLSWDVTAQAQTMYAGSDYGWLVRDAVESDATNEQTFRGRDGDVTQPQLEVTFG